jgi:signal peptidase II
MDQGREIRFYGMALLLLMADQISKSLIIRFIPPYTLVPIVPGFFNLTYVLNPGAAFGLLSKGDPSYRNPFFIGVSLVAILFILYCYWRQGRGKPLYGTGLGLVAGGALGNLLDRIHLGAVVDFLDFHLGRHHWPAFNLADSGISIGVALLVWQLWREARQ